MDVVEPAVVVTEERTQPAPRLRHRLEYAGLRAVLALTRLMSVERVAASGATIMRLVGPRLRQHTRAMRNLAIAFPDRSEAERQAIARAMWANMGRTFAETLVLDRIVAEPWRLSFPEEKRWAAEAVTAGPLLACTLHMGNWELIALALRAFGRRAAGVYKPLDNPLIDAWLHATRAPIYPNGLLGKGDRDEEGAGHKTARQLIDKARFGTLSFVADHFDRRGEEIPFMGRKARFTTVPAAIARHVGARVFLGRCVRLGAESRFHMEVTEVAVPRTGDRKADAVALTTAMMAVFEVWVREHPEQWMWWNMRWVE